VRSLATLAVNLAALCLKGRLESSGGGRRTGLVGNLCCGPEQGAEALMPGRAKWLPPLQLRWWSAASPTQLIRRQRH